MEKNKKFDGVWFYLDSNHRYNRTAKQTAERLRKTGYNVRIAKVKNDYVVYKRQSKWRKW